MKESTSYNNKERLISILSQITDAIERLKDWNASVQTSDDYYSSSSGMQKLAASCMLIEAIGESVNQIDKMTEGRLFSLRPDIPWNDVVGIRNHIAHGYFDIDFLSSIMSCHISFGGYGMIAIVTVFKSIFGFVSYLAYLCNLNNNY